MVPPRGGEGRLVSEMARTDGDLVLIPSSVGELIDKLTILAIKAERIADPAKLANIRTELDLLLALKRRHRFAGEALDRLEADLKSVNQALWTIEDDIRDCERRGDFGPAFVALARGVYMQNDRRAALKREINLLFGSKVVEEKSYAAY